MFFFFFSLVNDFCKLCEHCIKPSEHGKLKIWLARFLSASENGNFAYLSIPFESPLCCEPYCLRWQGHGRRGERGEGRKKPKGEGKRGGRDERVERGEGERGTKGERGRGKS